MSKATLMNSLVAETLTTTSGGIEPVADTPVTVSGQEMVRLTGVARERLRTWERRHGFPVPVRSPNNTRRFRAEDVRRVAAVHQLSASGVPLPDAIQAVLNDDGSSSSVTSLGAILDHAPSPALAISGPDPLRIAWVNGASAKFPAAPQVGDEVDDALSGLSRADRQALRELTIKPEARPQVLTHSSWCGASLATKRSIAWRAEASELGRAVVVLMELPDIPGRHTDTDASAALRNQGTRFAQAVGAARRELQAEPGLGGIQRAIAATLAPIGGCDAFIALRRHGALRVASSVRGTVARSVVAEHCEDIAQSLADGEIDWLSPETTAALGIPAQRAAVAVPLIAADERFGVVVFVFADEVPLGDAARELLASFGAAVALTLSRDRLTRASKGVRLRASEVRLPGLPVAA